MTRDITVPAADASGPGIYTESAGGRFFTLLSASGPLRLRINQEETQSLTAGASIGPHPQPIRSLVFYNAGEIVTARIYLGDTPMSSTDVQNVVTTSQADTFINTALNPPDGTSLTIANNATVPMTAKRTIGGKTYKRRSFNVSNTTNGFDLKLCTYDGANAQITIDLVQGGSVRFFGSDYEGVDLCLQNTSGGPIKAPVTEVLYSTPV